MSELITQRPGLSDFRWRLLATVSALTLLSLTAPETQAEDSDRPTVWIELGGQLSRLQDGQEIYQPPFVSLTPSGFSPPQVAERPPHYSFDGTGKLSFQSKDSDWTFSVSVQYGRSISNKNVRQQSQPLPFIAYQRVHNTSHRHGHQRTFAGTYYRSVHPYAARFTDASVKQSESHAILDFQAGKDVGVGLWGHEASSTLNIGVRVAKFTSKSRATLNENPDWKFQTNISVYDYIGSYSHNHATSQAVYQAYHSYNGSFRADRSFTGFGPSISWVSSTPFVGNKENGELVVDWGVNAAVLFGRQKTKTHHQTTGRYHSPGTRFHLNDLASLVTVYQHPATPDHIRSRTVVVPNIGAFAGFSVKYPNAKISFGYKADFFFGAMDGGIDVRRTEDIGFHGPYASVSIGLGG